MLPGWENAPRKTPLGKGQCSEPFQLEMYAKTILDMFTLKEKSGDLQINFLAKSSWTKSLDWSTSISIQVRIFNHLFFYEKKHPDPHPLWTMLEQRWFHVSTPTARHAPSHSTLLALSLLQRSPRRLAEIGLLVIWRLKDWHWKTINIHKQMSMKFTQISIKDYEFKQMSIKDDEYL